MRKIIRGIVLAAAAVIFIVSCINLFQIFSEYHRGETEYAQIQEYAVLPEEEETTAETDDFPMPDIDFDALVEINADFCAWLSIPALDLNYPVVWNGNNETYLTRTFEGESNSAGCLFVDAANRPDFLDRNTIIYGHNMKNGSMFGSLSDFQQKEELAEEEPYFYLYTEDAAMRFQIISYYTTTGDSSTYSLVNTDGEYDAYLRHILQNSQFSGYEGGLPEDRPAVVTMSTCHGRAGGIERFVLHGILSEKKEMERIAGRTTGTSF